MRKSVSIIFPHQLFEQSPLLDLDQAIYLVEEWLFFKQYNFHKQKIALHRASMKFYESYLQQKGMQVHYIDAINEQSDIRKLITALAQNGINQIDYIDPTDDWLGRRIQSSAKQNGIKLNISQNLSFLNSQSDNEVFFKASKKKFYQSAFYTEQRKKMNILVDENLSPIGGKWSFDSENRKKYPAKKQPPVLNHPIDSAYFQEAKAYVNVHFSDNLGELEQQTYPADFETSRVWLSDFLTQRFHDFGAYEDAIVQKEIFLNHSILTPMLNIGLLTPAFILKEVLKFAEKNNIPINSTEGFVRQIIGWREFIRGVYECKGRQERTTNYWGFTKKIPPSFYDGTTGIAPIDDTIKKILKTGYCHHIERLMILGNFMVLNEFDPDEVYRWFMEIFVDAYDWVMVTNVYGMSQFADGGLMATKPYISGSNYIMKMSNYPKGQWQVTWDGLFWRFMDKHRDFFLKNPRLGMLINTFDKMNEDKKQQHLTVANNYLTQTNNLVS
jgi:deoxyribodipyrimidine photolyase-related protein